MFAKKNSVSKKCDIGLCIVNCFEKNGIQRNCVSLNKNGGIECSDGSNVYPCTARAESLYLNSQGKSVLSYAKLTLRVSRVVAIHIHNLGARRDG